MQYSIIALTFWNYFYALSALIESILNSAKPKIQNNFTIGIWEISFCVYMSDTYSELRERKPWKASGAASEIWLLLRSLK